LVVVIFMVFIALMQVVAQAPQPRIIPPEKHPPGLPVYRIADERIEEDWINRGIIVINPDGSGHINLNEIDKLIEDGFYKETPDGLVFTTKGKIFYYIYKLENTIMNLCSFC